MKSVEVSGDSWKSKVLPTYQMVRYCPSLQYDPDARMIVVDVKKEVGDRQFDLTQMAYYMEKDVCAGVSEGTGSPPRSLG